MHLDVGGRAVYAYTGSRGFDAAQPTVMFVYGAANDHSVFALQSRYFAWHGMNVLAVDTPGHGRSEGEALESVEGIADWLAALPGDPVVVGIDAPLVVRNALGQRRAENLVQRAFGRFHAGARRW